MAFHPPHEFLVLGIAQVSLYRIPYVHVSPERPGPSVVLLPAVYPPARVWLLTQASTWWGPVT